MRGDENDRNLLGAGLQFAVEATLPAKLIEYCSKGYRACENGMIEGHVLGLTAKLLTVLRNKHASEYVSKATANSFASVKKSGA